MTKGLSKIWYSIMRKKEKLIYTITTINQDEKCWDSRCVGFYYNKEIAIKTVEHNCGDIYECGSYPYAVIESVGDGLYYINREEIWFKWNKASEKYEMLKEKPEMFNKTCCYGIG
jgi:hypothetical protein